MKIKPVDMTTPLNVEMLKQLKETMVATNEQAGYENCAPATPGGIAHSEARERSATAVMRAIAHFCTPMVACVIPGGNS